MAKIYQKNGDLRKVNEIMFEGSQINYRMF